LFAWLITHLLENSFSAFEAAENNQDSRGNKEADNANFDRSIYQFKKGHRLPIVNSKELCCECLVEGDQLKFDDDQERDRHDETRRI
jgi:hypothetical protein